ncbi:PaaI family thioesterase [Ekhidna sp.]|uniref:PaaI family thioesterase n=1 Tax=Ekhidna sp. TaxID=2608089 RepID=UPI00329846B6
MSESKYFQDHMPENVCFGCGSNHEGLQIKSYWDGDISVCEWRSEEKYHGWSNLMNGGIMATLIDCHCMGTAMADAYKKEGRSLATDPEYRYATGTLTVKYLKPTPNTTVELRARVVEVKGRKTVLKCDFLSESGEKTAEADVVAIRVYDSSENKTTVFKS